MGCQFLLYNKVSQLHIYKYPHISSLLRLPPTRPTPPLQVVKNTELISLCYVASFHQLSILHLAVYICPCQPLTSPQLTLSLPVSSSQISMSASLYLSCPQVLQNNCFFIDSIYMCQHTVFVFLFLTSLCMTQSTSIHLTTNNSILFLFMAE